MENALSPSCIVLLACIFLTTPNKAFTDSVKEIDASVWWYNLWKHPMSLVQFPFDCFLHTQQKESY